MNELNVKVLSGTRLMKSEIPALFNQIAKGSLSEVPKVKFAEIAL